MKFLVFKTAAIAILLLAGCADNVTENIKADRHYTFRAVGGASMGAMTAAQMGLRYHELFDILAPSGGGLDLGMLIHWFKDGMLGGFCVPPRPGEMCPDPDQNQDYEHMNCGGPAAGGFDREGMIKTAQDMFIAYGNMTSFNPEHHYLPAGLTASYFDQSPEEMCANPVSLTGYYDWRFNPKGIKPVITFCEADGPEEGIFDPSMVPTQPVEFTYAVDLNDNKKRDPGEPVIFQLGERYDDVGEDGLASADETGFDPQNNPDPAADDYHPLNNPLGTEKNHLYDEGEPYLDWGLDGVAFTSSSPYDWGEGNGHYDYSPHVLRTAAMYDPSHLIQNLSSADLDRLDFYIDVGIRDHLGFRDSCEAFAGKLGARGREIDLRYRYESVLKDDYTGPYDIHFIDWDNIGRDLMIIYGDPDASPEEIKAGDGGHVGSGSQLFYRMFTMMSFVSEHWPDGAFKPMNPSDPTEILDLTYYSEILGMDRQYFILLPPGYDEHPNKTYPVFYLFHGSGMDAQILTATSLLVDPWMNEGAIQKFIMVFPDGVCQDDCNSGNFFANQMGRHLPGRRYEDSIIEELIPLIDENFRTKKPQDFPRP
ncbi:MAG: hypothetical protein JRJ87_21630 [Deltaproteobacteria bacterium]|nr:hypothetical protein [Deltaproteobacteria bacterium]